jgi:predicted Zn-dependent peptidase
LLNNLLGGPALNSRLSVEVREKRGLSYTIEAGHASFESCGLWNIYFSCDRENTERILEIIFKELTKLKQQYLRSMQLERAKKQFCGQLIIAKENPASWLHSMGKTYLSSGLVQSPLEIIKQIQTITNTELYEIANECFHADTINLLLYRN